MNSWWDVKLEGTELASISQVLESGFLNEGPITEKLETRFSIFLGTSTTIFCTSGTIALYLALKAAGIGPGNIVAVPNLTFIATANAVKLCGAEVHLVDIEPETLNISSESLRASIAQLSIDAVIVVHVSGRSAFTSELFKTINEHDILLFEDAAEGFGSKDPITGKYLGTIGLAGAFSYSPNKVITSGQGGAVVTNDPEIAHKIRELKDQGRAIRGTGGADNHPGTGFNFKFTDIQAAILSSQFDGVEKRLKHLRETYLAYVKYLPDSQAGSLLKFDIAKGEVPLWPEFRSKQRDSLLKHLDSHSIGYRKIWFPLSSQPSLYSPNLFLNSHTASSSTFWLSSNFNLTEIEVKRISTAILEFRVS